MWSPYLWTNNKHASCLVLSLSHDDNDDITVEGVLFRDGGPHSVRHTRSQFEELSAKLLEDLSHSYFFVSVEVERSSEKSRVRSEKPRANSTFFRSCSKQQIYFPGGLGFKSSGPKLIQLD